MQTGSKFTIALCAGAGIVVEIGEEYPTLDEARAAAKQREQDAKDGGHDASYVVVVGEEQA